MSNENSYSEFSFFSRFQKNGKARNKHNIRINSKDILNNLSLEISPRSFNTKKKLYSFQDYKNSLNDSSSTSDNKNSIFSTLNNRKIRLNNLSPKIFFERPNKEINSIRSAYNSPINCSLQDLIIDSKENRNLSPKINLFINENNSNNNNKESPNIISKLREFKTELFNLKQENKDLKNENEEFQEILKNLKEEFKHIKDRSRNNDKIIEQEKTIKNLNSFLERQEKDFNEEKKEILNELNEQIEENKKLSEQIVKMGKWKNNYSQDFQSQLKSQEKMLKIQDEQIESLQDQIYLLTNRGGNNTIPSDPNESFDN
jgi:hypothetical protein